MAEKFSVSFKDTDIERKLVEWIKKKSEIIGFASYVKQVLYEKMLEEEKETTEK
jgi:hypothetical protein